jgi:hypothetical protein
VTGGLSPLLMFHWDGYWGAARPRPGRYDVEIQLLTPEPGGPPRLIAAVREPAAIRIEVADLTLSDESPAYVDWRALAARTRGVTIGYRIDGSPTLPDRIVMTVRDQDGTVVGRTETGAAAAGTLVWDGRPPRSRDVVPPGVYEVTIEGLRGTRSLTGAVRTRVTIYDVEVEQTTPGRGLAIMSNLDDDDQDGRRDFDQTGRISGDDELMGLRLRIVPPVDGDFVITGLDPALTHLYAAADKSGGVLPASELPASTRGEADIWLDTVATSDLQLDLSFRPRGEPAFSLVRQVLPLIQLFVQNNEPGERVPFNLIGTMNSFDQYGPADARRDANFVLRMARSADFIVYDRQNTQLFLIDRQVFDGTGPAPDDVELTVATLTGAGLIDDDPTTVYLRADVGNEELWQIILLVGSDLPRNPDDDLPVDDGRTGPVADDAPGDRTHRADIDGAIRVTYRRSTGEVWNLTQPICKRDPEQRRYVYLRLTVLRDPATGLLYMPAIYGGDVALYADTILGAANSVWAPYCLKFFWRDPPVIVNAPRDPTSAVSPPHIFTDGSFDIPHDSDILKAAFEATFQPWFFDVFAVAPSPGANGRAFLRGPGWPTDGNLPFATIGSDAPSVLTLAHELGHLLTNQGNSEQPTFVVYPSDYPSQWLYSTADDRVNEARRIGDGTAIIARTDRSLAHAIPGDLTSAPPVYDAPGNYALHLPTDPRP